MTDGTDEEQSGHAWWTVRTVAMNVFLPDFMNGLAGRLALPTSNNDPCYLCNPWLMNCSARAGPQQADHHALDDELGGGQQVGVAGIFGAEERGAALDEKTFERGFAVDQRGNDVLLAWFARREEDGVAVEDAGVD